RGRNVTGVQTCALPIFDQDGGVGQGPCVAQWACVGQRACVLQEVWSRRQTASTSTPASRRASSCFFSLFESVIRCWMSSVGTVRSEERRVGKEARCGME